MCIRDRWAGPYLYSRQMVAVRKESEINTIQDLEGKKIAVQATTKAEDLFLHKIASAKSPFSFSMEVKKRRR